MEEAKRAISYHQIVLKSEKICLCKMLRICIQKNHKFIKNAEALKAAGKRSLVFGMIQTLVVKDQ